VVANEEMAATRYVLRNTLRLALESAEDEDYCTWWKSTASVATGWWGCCEWGWGMQTG